MITEAEIIYMHRLSDKTIRLVHENGSVDVTEISASDFEMLYQGAHCEWRFEIHPNEETASPTGYHVYILIGGTAVMDGVHISGVWFASNSKHFRLDTPRVRTPEDDAIRGRLSDLEWQLGWERQKLPSEFNKETSDDS